MSNRYIIFHGSASAHCCFKATVMDTKNDPIYEDENGKHYETVCECFDMPDAEKIANALNKANETLSSE